MRRPRGHSLLEVFLAIVLVSVLLFAVASLFPSAWGALGRSRDMETAANLAQQTVEAARVASFDAPDPAPTTVSLNNVQYQITQQSVVLNPPQNDVKRVHVEVVWSVAGFGPAPEARVVYETCVYRLTNP